MPHIQRVYSYEVICPGYTGVVGTIEVNTPGAAESYGVNKFLEINHLESTPSNATVTSKFIDSYLK